MRLTQTEREMLVSDAGQDRFCPDPTLFQDKENAALIAEHTSWCAPCYEMLETGLLENRLAWDELTWFACEGEMTEKERPPVKAGQIWRLSDAHCGWGEQAIWFHAPDVLILEVFPYAVARVAHISPFYALVGPQDFQLEPNQQSAFAEMWNTWSVPVSWLAHFLGRMSKDRFGALRLISLADGTREFQADPVQTRFRQQELFHSAHFAMAAMDEVVSLAEEHHSRLESVATPSQQQNTMRVGANIAQFRQELNEYGLTSSQDEEDKSSLSVAAAGHKRTVKFAIGGSENSCVATWSESGITFSVRRAQPGAFLWAALEDMVLEWELPSGEKSKLIPIDREAPLFCAINLTASDFLACKFSVSYKTDTQE